MDPSVKAILLTALITIPLTYIFTRRSFLKGKIYEREEEVLGLLTEIKAVVLPYVEEGFQWNWDIPDEDREVTITRRREMREQIARARLHFLRDEDPDVFFALVYLEAGLRSAGVLEKDTDERSPRRLAHIIGQSISVALLDKIRDTLHNKIRELDKELYT